MEDGDGRWEGERRKEIGEETGGGLLNFRGHSKDRGRILKKSLTNKKGL